MCAVLVCGCRQKYVYINQYHEYAMSDVGYGRTMIVSTINSVALDWCRFYIGCIK